MNNRRALDQRTGDVLEITDEIVDLVTFYTQTLAVPAAKEAHEHDLFIQTQCSRCHILRLEKGVMSDLPEVSNQINFACTDLLLHNMDEALADGRRDFRATGSEWRAPPLWGLGLTQLISQHTNLLHDGRAHNITEVILRHGGEAEASKDRFKHLSKNERDVLLTFLESL